MTTTRTIFLLMLFAALAAIAVPGCRGRGGSAEVTTTNNSTTTGKELQDLEDAKAKGLLTDDEYKKERKRILSHQ
jgi:hypothetical protein